MTHITTTARGTRAMAALRLMLCSLLGIVLFFVPVELNGKSTILLDHAASAISTGARPAAIAFVCLLMAYGAFAPFVQGTWRKTATNAVFSVLRVLGLALALLYLAGIGPAAIFVPDMLPFLFDKLVLSVGLIVPIGALALAFLVGYGLLEFTGVLVQPIMRGRSGAHRAGPRSTQSPPSLAATRWRCSSPTGCSARANIRCARRRSSTPGSPPSRPPS